MAGAREFMERALEGWVFPDPQLRSSRASLGIRFDARPDAERAEDGVRVTGVGPLSPAREAGVRAGDLVIAFDGAELSNPLPQGGDDELDPELARPAARLLLLASRLEPGDTVTLRILRDDEERDVEIVTAPFRGPGMARARMAPRSPRHRMGPGQEMMRCLRSPAGTRFRPGRPGLPEMEMDHGRVAGASPGTLWRTQGRFGLRLHDLNEGLARYFGTEQGALVLEVADRAELPLAAGDVLVSIDGREVRDARHAAQILRSYRSGESMTMEILREGRTMQVEISAP